MRDTIAVALLLAFGAALGWGIAEWLLSTGNRPETAALPHRALWELDPQGQGENSGPENCRPPRVPYYIYPDGVTPFYVECLKDHLND